MPPRLPLFLALAALPVQSARAQPTAMPTPAPAAPTLTPLYSFSVETFTSARVTNDEYVNHDGDKPSGLISPGDGFLYGTASQGGANGDGTVFKVRTDGTAFTVLHTFSDDIKRPIGWLAGVGPNADGGAPEAALVAPGDGFLYGTTRDGGASGSGTVFRLRRDGTGFTVLHAFGSMEDGGVNADGINPRAALVAPGDGYLYGTAAAGGAGAFGTVFKIRRDGTAFTVLHAFGRVNGVYVSADGISPMTALVWPGDGFLYGTNRDAIFKVRPNGTGFAALHGLDTFPAGPEAPLIAPGDGYLYGTTRSGTVFRLRPDGSGFQTLHTFTYADGSAPEAALVAPGDGFLYGTTFTGGVRDCGVVFRLSPDGTGFTVLHDFNRMDGANPHGTLAAPGDGFLYGTENDRVYRLAIPKASPPASPALPRH